MPAKTLTRRDFLKSSTIAAISVSPVVQPLSTLFGITESQTSGLIDFGLRLSRPENLLNLDFYFINVAFKNKCIFSKPRLISNYEQQRSFMVVRLPQQHIAEEYYPTTPGIDLPPPKDWIAKTTISGYSYLVFALFTSPESRKLKIPVTEAELLDWNDENKYKLVIRQNLNDSLFNIKINKSPIPFEQTSDDKDKDPSVFYENVYPLGYTKVTDQEKNQIGSPKTSSKKAYRYEVEKYPKVYGDPITAIEAPWRLIVSPKLPDPLNYRYKWIFSKNDAINTASRELWMATLTAVPVDYPLYHNYVAGDQRKRISRNDGAVNDLNLMFIGSPDHRKSEHYGADDYFRDKILPKDKDRFDLVELYIKYKLLAHTNRISFSPLGAGVHIDFKNTRIDETINDPAEYINLYTYKHLLSFGRDEEVEITELILDKETGMKMLLVRTTKRRTKKGIAFLDYREYIMPLELEKDYQNHDDENGVSKFRSPFKKIRFVETGPKRIYPLDLEGDVYDNSNSNLAKITFNGQEHTEGVFYPQASSPGVKSADLDFLIEVTDWHDEVHTVKKKIQAVTYGCNYRIKEDADFTVETIDDFFDKTSKPGPLNTSIDEQQELSECINNNFSALLSDVHNYAQGTAAAGQQTFFDKTVEQLTELKNLLPSGRIGELITNRRNLLVNLVESKAIDFKRIIKDKISAINIDTLEFINKLRVSFDQANELYKTASQQLASLKKQISDETDANAGELRRQSQTATNSKDRLDRAGEAFRKALTSASGKIEKIQDQINKLDPVTDARKIKELQGEIEAVKAKLVKTENGLRGRYAEILKETNLDNVKDLADLIAAIRNFASKLENDIKNIQNAIESIKKAINDKYKAQIDKLISDVSTYKTEADKLDNILKSSYEKIKEKISSDYYLLIVQRAEDWFKTLNHEYVQRLDEMLSAAAASRDMSAIFSDKIDELVCDAQLFVVSFKNYLPPVQIPLSDGVTIVEIDLTPSFSDYLDSITSEIKLLLFDFSYRYLRAFDDLDQQIKQNLMAFRKRFIDDVLNQISLLKLQEQNIRNAIYTYRDKVGYAVTQVLDNIKDHINGELSALETDFVVLKGQMKTVLQDNKALIDFFHQYASIPQLQHAQVYISSLSKLISQEIPVGIQYAKDYVSSQVDLYNFNIEKNTARVFAEVKEFSKDKIKGRIREISREMGGLVNPEIAVDFLSYIRHEKELDEKLLAQLPADVQQNIARSKAAIAGLKDQLVGLRDEINANVKATEAELRELNNRLKDTVKKYTDELNNSPLVKDVVLLGKEAKDFYDEAKSFSPETFFKNLDAKILGSIHLSDILGLDFDLPKLSPSGDAVTYNFITNKLKSKDFSFFRFTADTATEFQIYFTKKIKDSSFLSFTRLSNFRVTIRIFSEDVLLIKFREFKISSSNTESKKVSVKMDGVTFGGPLDFFGKLAEKLQMPGSGLRILPSFDQLEVGYDFPLPSITSPGFNFANIKFDIGLIVPYANSSSVKALTLVAGINRKEDKFLLTAGIYGGRGYFTMRATPDSLQSIDAGVEFGGYFGINLGIASGYVFLFAGISLYYEKSGNLTLSGYLICEGGVVVFGFISIYLTIQLSMIYQRVNGNAALFGTASVRYSISIGFFKKSFEISFSKTIAGSQGSSNIQGEEHSAYLNRGQQPVYYASADRGKEFENRPLSYIEDNPEKQAVRDHESAKFENIYNKKDWTEYYTSFNLD